MRNEKKFDKLTPAEQVAINTMAEKVEANELINAYKEKIAQETLKKKPVSAGEIIFILILIAFVCLILFLPIIQLNSYMNDLKSVGPIICKNQGSIFINADFSGFSTVKINCADFTITLP